jgi:hypothetical protein
VQRGTVLPWASVLALPFFFAVGGSPQDTGVLPEDRQIGLFSAARSFCGAQPCSASPAIRPQVDQFPSGEWTTFRAARPKREHVRAGRSVAYAFVVHGPFGPTKRSR